MHALTSLIGDHPHHAIANSVIIHADSFVWLRQLPPQSIHAVVTDPPYGVKEYTDDQLEKRSVGKGGIWRIPPTFDGHRRAPLPRFTALSPKELDHLTEFFTEWARLINHVLLPGGHVFIASNAFLAQTVFQALTVGGLEFRGQIIRLVQTLRGGDRPKNAEDEFPDVNSMPRGGYEPWGLFRKPLPSKMTVRDCLRTFKTGALRRKVDRSPFVDVITSGRTPQREREIAPHPSLKPQALMRQIVWASLPLGDGVILDPFMGGGSTIAAALAMGYDAVGVERDANFFAISRKAIPLLSAIGSPAIALDQPPLFVDHD